MIRHSDEMGYTDVGPSCYNVWVVASPGEATDEFVFPVPELLELPPPPTDCDRVFFLSGILNTYRRLVDCRCLVGEIRRDTILSVTSAVFLGVLLSSTRLVPRSVVPIAGGGSSDMKSGASSASRALRFAVVVGALGKPLDLRHSTRNISVRSSNRLFRLVMKSEN